MRQPQKRQLGSDFVPPESVPPSPRPGNVANAEGKKSTTWDPKVVGATVASRVERQKRLGELLYSSPHVWADKQRKQQIIADRVLSRSKAMKGRNFQSVARHDLELMAYLYDEQFLEGIALPLAESYGLSFRLSSRMTRAGGKTTRTVYPSTAGRPSRTHYEIALSTSLLFQSFRGTDDNIRVCGYDCRDRLTAMQRIVEHELIHLCEMLVWIQSDCSAGRFQSIAHGMFGHTEHRHELITQQQRAAKDYNIRAGNRVAFRFEGKTIVGVVNRITRRATILVEDSRGERFSDGKRYLKYYVPINQLRPIA